jgi:hypothetical protein
VSKLACAIDPVMTAPTSCGDTPARANTARAALMPRSVGDTAASAPL